MHDEAAPLYTEMVDQTTRGHQFLKKNFGADAVPRGTWQIDPFGHSNTQAWLLGAEAGMESMYWGRTDFEDFNMRKNQSRLEWVWQGSQSLGDTAQIFAGELYGGGGGGYGTWIGFDGAGTQVQDDPSRHDYNVDKMVDSFVQHAQSQAAHTRTEHQMWACGSDFQYQNADHWYRNLDKLIHYINKNGTVNAFYSTPSLYTDQKRKAGLKWEVRQDDIFPLADAGHHYWSGYFTSRPALKKQVRVATNFLSAARQLEVLSGVTAAEVDLPTTRPSPPVGTSWTDSLEGTIGVATHHDGMSGTERQDVADDYSMRISESHVEVEKGVAMSLEKLMGLDEGQHLDHCNCNAYGAEDCLNITVCSATTGPSEFSIVAYNPQGQESTQVLRIPVQGAGPWTATDVAKQRGVPAQALAISDRTLSLPLLYLNKHGMSQAEQDAWKEQNANPATHVLSVQATIPAMGYTTLVVQKGKTEVAEEQQQRVVDQKKYTDADGNTVVSNGHYELTFDGSTGLMSQIKNLASNISTPFSIEWGWYNSSVGGCTAGIEPETWACDSQKSGAYIFRPNSSTFFYPGKAQTPTIEVVSNGGGGKDGFVTEIRQTFSDWASHTIRMYSYNTALAPYIEVEWTAGPIPIDTPWIDPVVPNKPNIWGKEVSVRYNSGLESKGTFYTDSNGREMVKRVYNARGPSYPTLNVTEPVAGNYYPVNAMMSLDDGCAELAIITDVSQGGASLKDGSLELMVHRRIQDDDSRGVQEPLNETMCGCNDINAAPGQMGQHGHEGDGGCECAGLTVRGRHWIVLDTVEKSHELRRQAVEQLSFPATLAFMTQGAAKAKNPAFSALAAALPPNVKLMTVTDNYKDINQGATMLRLSHMYSVGEHPTLSEPATVDLAVVFAKQGFTIATATETSLTGNQAPVHPPKWNTIAPNAGVQAQLDEHRDAQSKNGGKVPFDRKDPKLSVTLRPMELRTFFVTFKETSGRKVQQPPSAIRGATSL